MNKTSLENLSLNLIKLNIFISVVVAIFAIPMLLKNYGGYQDLIYWFPYVDFILFIIPAFIVIKGSKDQNIDKAIKTLVFVGIISIVFDIIRIRVLEVPISFKTALICVLAGQLLEKK